MGTTGRLITILLVIATAGCEASRPTPGPTGGNPSPASATGSPSSATPSPMPAPTASELPPVATTFAAPTDRSKNGRLRLSTVLSSNNSPLAGTPVSVTITALDSTWQTVILKGIVPVETKSALVGFRFNEEGAGPTRIDLNVYRITYADGGSSKNRVTNSEFSSGLYSWDVWGSGKATILSSDLGDGRMLRLRARPDQNIGINSFGVQRFTPGSDFKLTVNARVPPAGADTGYAAVFFLWGKNNIEGHRVTVPLVAPPVPKVDLLTDDGGAVALDVAMPAGRYMVSIAYFGDDGRLSATIEQQVTVP